MGPGDRVLMVGEEGRERERESEVESEESRRIGPTVWGNLINVNAAATAGATRRVWQSLICNSTLPPFLFSPFHPFSYSPDHPRHPLADPRYLVSPQSLSAITCIVLNGQLGGLLNIWERGKGSRLRGD